MFGFIIALVSALAGYAAMAHAHVGAWSVFYAAALFFIVQLLIGLTIRSRMKKKQNDIQSVMAAAQEKINRQMMLFQRRPPSSMREAQEQLAKMQNDAARKVLTILDECNRYTWWNWMLARQLNAMRVQLYFQLREFKKVDALLPKALVVDQQTMAIKLVRLYRNDDPALDRFYEKKCAKTKNEAAAYLASVYAWIKLKENEVSKATQALIAARRKSDNPVLLENCDRLVNGKIRQFSNAQFGDAWYALMLEEPKAKVQRQQRMY
ncbi:MAG: hypothetical protein MJ016_05690 [Victivallaceae bacterium]|nr:hypothetical protein [Victivallaceae bacterium]